MELNLGDYYCTISFPLSSEDLQVIINNFSYMSDSNSYHAYDSIIYFDDNERVERIRLGKESKIDGMSIIYLSTEEIFDFKVKFQELGYIMNENIKEGYIEIQQDWLNAQLINGDIIPLRLNMGSSAELYGEGEIYNNESVVWHSSDDTFHKSITIHGDRYRVAAWGKFSMLGFTVGDVINMDDIRKNPYYITENGSELKFLYDGVEVIAQCQNWSINTKLILGVTINLKR